jgi:hypothetical protein
VLGVSPFPYAAAVAQPVSALVLATVLCGGGVLLGAACSGDSEKNTLISVQEARQAFHDHGIELTAAGAPSEFGAALVPADSNQVQVVVFPSPREARARALVRTGTQDQFEVAHGTDVLFRVRNLYVVFDTSGSDYSRDAIRAALLELD